MQGGVGEHLADPILFLFQIPFISAPRDFSKLVFPHSEYDMGRVVFEGMSWLAGMFGACRMSLIPVVGFVHGGGWGGVLIYALGARGVGVEGEIGR